MRSEPCDLAEAGAECQLNQSGVLLPAREFGQDALGLCPLEDVLRFALPSRSVLLGTNRRAGWAQTVRSCGGEHGRGSPVHAVSQRGSPISRDLVQRSGDVTRCDVTNPAGSERTDDA